MELLSEPNWRWDAPDDLWMECYLRASWDHRRMIHEIMKKYCLTTREAVQKLYKCDEESALHDTIPWEWNTPVIQRLREQEILRTIGHEFDGLVAATHTEPAQFDAAIRTREQVEKFLAWPRDIQGGDAHLRKI
jgi:hypothetical protein